MLGQTPMAQLLGYEIGPVNTLSQIIHAKLQLLSVRYIRVSFRTKRELPLTNYGK